MYKKELINQKMLADNLTNDDLAEKANLNKNTISKVRNGKTTVKVCTLQNVADSLGIEMSELFEKKQTATV